MEVVKVTINNIEIQQKDGLIYVDNLNETLDSGIIIIENTKKINMQPLDLIDITFPDNVKKRFCVISYEEQVASYNPATYNYQIQYSSPVILFERITLPNIAITKVFKEENNEDYLIQENDYYVRSVLYYVQQYLTEYTNEEILNCYLDSSLMTRLLVKCPEFQFNRPTLKEVLQELFSVVDLVFTCQADYSQDNVYLIKGLDVNEVGKEIDITLLDSDITRNSVENYATNLDVEMNDAISPNSRQTIQMMSLRSTDGILTTTNASLITDNNIYSIEKLELNLDFYTLNLNELMPNYAIGWVDLTHWLVEKSVHDVLSVGSVEDLESGGLYKNNTFYYTQGSNTIEGFGDTYKNWLGFEGLGWKYTLKYVLEHLAYPSLDDTTITQFTSYVEENLITLLFRVTYTSQADAKMHVERNKKLKNYSVLFDNQENRLINVSTFSNYETDKLNRISNEERVITAVYNNWNDVPALSDYIGDYILTNRELSIYDNHIVFKGLLTKNFANRYQFNALNSQKRFYNITSDTIIRHELEKIYFTISHTMPENLKNNSNFMLNFENKKISHVVLNHTFLDTTGIQVIKECVVTKASNSILISFGYNDNVVAGYQIGEEVTGGHAIKGIKYVDDYGENVRTIFSFFGNPRDVIEKGDEYKNNSWQISKMLPHLTNTTSLGFSDTPSFRYYSNKHKDQAEIQKWTLQTLFVSEDDNIIIGEGFVDYNAFFGGISNFVENVSVVVKATGRFTTKDAKNLNYTYSVPKNDFEITIDNNTMSIKLTNIPLPSNIALVYQGKALLMFNDYSSEKPIYIDTKYFR